MTTIICRVDALEDDQSKGFSVNGVNLLVVKKDAQLYVYENWCPHLGISLEYVEDQFLDADNAFIQCSNHGALFEIENGNCVVGPCQGQSLKPIGFDIQGDELVLK